MRNTKIRIYELSKELHLENREILEVCDDLNIAYKSHSSTISEADAERIKAAAPKYLARRKIPRKKLLKPEQKQQIIAIHHKEKPLSPPPNQISVTPPANVSSRRRPQLPPSISPPVPQIMEYGSIKKYIRREVPEKGFGFVGRTFSNLNREVFFNNGKISRRYPELAQKLENGEDIEAVNFWYTIEIGEKGERVSELWLNANKIPKNHADELFVLTKRVESIWRDISSPKPSWLDRVTIDLVGVDRRDELSNERDSLEIQRRLTDRKRHRDAEAERLKQIEARREKERQETELRIKLRIKLEAERQEQIRVAQEEVCNKAEQLSQQRKNEIRRICQEIGIEILVHFTHVQNLKSILQCGLVGRSQLEEMSLEFKYNDEVRLERQLEAICLSISFPNYKMFFACRKKETDFSNDNWVVLLLKSSILWELNCKFYVENAASRNARNSDLRGDRTQPSALREMFQDYGSIRRATLGIPKNFTTHPQAEVLVFNSITVDYIQSVHFFSKTIAEEWLRRNSFEEASYVKFDYSGRYFVSRPDSQRCSSQSLSSTVPKNTVEFDNIPF